MNFHNYQQTILFNPDNVQDGETYQKYVSALHNFGVDRDKIATLSERAYQAWDSAAIKAAAQPKATKQSKPFVYSNSAPTASRTLANTAPNSITVENVADLVHSESDLRTLCSLFPKTNFSFAKKELIKMKAEEVVKAKELEREAAKEQERLRRFKGE